MLDEKIDVSERKDISDDINWPLRIIYEANRNQYAPKVCKVCYNLMKKAMSFNKVENVSVNNTIYRTHFLF